MFIRSKICWWEFKVPAIQLSKLLAPFMYTTKYSFLPHVMNEKRSEKSSFNSRRLVSARSTPQLLMPYIRGDPGDSGLVLLRYGVFSQHSCHQEESGEKISSHSTLTQMEAQGGGTHLCITYSIVRRAPHLHSWAPGAHYLLP